MPPRTRGAKGKEILVAVDKTRSKCIGKNKRDTKKKALTLASENVSSSETRKNYQKHVATGLENMPRPRRERRLPTRYVGNDILNNLSNSKQSEDGNLDSKLNLTPVMIVKHVKLNTITESPFKTPQKSLDNSLHANMPKRICRLPSKLNDHSVSPSKFIPVKPCHASTPIHENKTSKIEEKVSNKENKIQSGVSKIIPYKRLSLKRHIQNSPETNSDSNNNAKRRLTRQKAIDLPKKSPEDKVPSNKKPKTVPNESFSLRVSEDKNKHSKNEVNVDVYEFTYDPSEEPAPAKKKRKRTVKKKPAKPKTVAFKINYDKNISKALAALKNVVSKKPDAPISEVFPSGENVRAKVAQAEKCVANQNVDQIPQQNSTQVVNEHAQIQNNSKPVNVTHEIEEHNYNSVRVEDIAADFEVTTEDYNDINYSPINSQQRPKTPVATNETVEPSMHNNDPLNLRGELSFFNDNPVASSSMNMSTRHPEASPWRVEFGNLPIRWQANTYVKPNMTPAVESSFINSEDNKKRHVYTNMITHDDSAPEVEQNKSNLKQTSIISFIREVVERSAQKKKRARSATPTKASNLFDELTNGDHVKYKTPNKSGNDESNKNVVENVSSSSGDSNHDKENSEVKEKKKKKSKAADKDGTFFGFDESEDQENQENMSPVKVNPKARALRPRSRAVLQEINAMTGPMRALPLTAKSKIASSSDAVNKVYEEPKSAADAPVFPDKGTMQKSREVTAIDVESYDVDDDAQSVHLFEDIEFVHHLKPTRKSYGKGKKVTFRQHSSSSETANVTNELDRVSSEEDDLADLTFTMPSFQPPKKAKKKVKKQKMSKKEQQAMEEWAAGFNSMCEDIEEEPLVIE